MPEQDAQRAERDTALERTIFLSDGVFAIATTLLVLTIGIPGGSQARGLPKVLIGLLWPSTAMYALSFIVIGIYWMAHQRIFHYITRSDGGLLWLNVLFLLTVAFLP
ncbi:MAG TPA: TMEM175 family protein, partial [Ktedonobacterales bacterium]|nr:TMEM175 family protein [Ktedonobacterales bacterium]